MTERKSLSGGDWLAIGTCFLGMLVAVLMVFGMWTGAGGSEGTAALAARIAGAIGPWPALVAGAGVAFLGARAFLSGERGSLLASVLGVLGTAAGLAVVAGSMGGDHGGALGSMTGGRVAELSHAAVGVLLGAIVAFGAAYFAWLREDPAAAAKLAPARRLTPAPPKSDDGVSAAESAMLFPGEREATDPAAVRSAPRPAKPVQPLYPEDVRKKGEIPAGARPLGAPSASPAGPAPASAPEPAVYRWTAPRATPAPDPTRIAPEEIEALADNAPPAPVPADDERIAVAFLAESSGILESTTDEADELETRPRPPRPTWETTGLTEDDEPVDAYGTPLSLVEKARREAEESAPAASARVPRELDAPLDADALARDEAVLEALEREVDAEVPANVAGAPAADEGLAALEFEGLVAEAELDREAELALEAQHPGDDGSAGEEPPVMLTAVERRVVAGFVVETVSLETAAESSATPEAHEALDSGSAAASLLEELRASNAALRGEAHDPDGIEALEAELAEVEAELESDPIAELEAVLAAEEAEAARVETLEAPEIAAAERMGAAVHGLEASEDSDASEADLVAELEEADAALAALDAELALEPEPRAEAEPARAAGAVPRAKPVAPSLFDAVEEEREVVLEPHAAVPASRAEKSPGRGLDPQRKLLAEVGCMFVDRGRVAVSMLQRQYGMDFDAACRVLDDLQELGLIGPYLGGKSRDILLSKDEWLEKVGAA
ncbi:MAG: hypothetical protein JNK02_02305 [Planctomycetes bacterium]|nr:hypothetical protein [Planctomycetota bacterium]